MTAFDRVRVLHGLEEHAVLGEDLWVLLEHDHESDIGGSAASSALSARCFFFSAQEATLTKGMLGAVEAALAVS